MKLVKSIGNQKGFTLVELIVVIAILGILAAIAIPRFNDQTTKANTAKLASDLSAIDTAIVQGQADGKINSTTNTSDLIKAAITSNYYLTVWPTSPRGSAYYYPSSASASVEKTVTGGTYDIDVSKAANYRGAFNTTGTDAITNSHAEDWHKE